MEPTYMTPLTEHDLALKALEYQGYAQAALARRDGNAMRVAEDAYIGYMDAELVEPKNHNT